MRTRIAAQQVNAAGALLTMVTTFFDLPEAELRLERLPSDGNEGEFAWGVNISLHDNLGHFEQWRAALGLAPSAVTAYLDDDNITNWLDVFGTWSGVPVRLLGFFHFHTPEHKP